MVVAGEQSMFAVRIKHLFAFRPLHLSVLSVSVDCRQVAASGSGLAGHVVGEASVWMLCVRLLPSCSGAMADQPVHLQCQLGGMNDRLLISMSGFGAALPPRGLGHLKFWLFSSPVFH